MNAWHRRFAKLFEQHSRHLVQIATRRLRDREKADEIVQDVYTRLFNAGSSGNQDDDTRILYASVRNAITDHHRSTIRRQQAWDLILPAQVSLVEVTTPEDQMKARQALSALDRALHDLRPRARQIFLLHRVHGISNAEIAQRYGISVSAVEKQLARVMRHCQTCLEAHMNDTWEDIK